ncbi:MULTISPECIES: PH domain-containing protein [Arthrobacter]|uniref:PH domain-containing protein n=1 Tax=Arthrobacter sunyaminii TaxID=2816859 RepID=A0A975XLV9_9MICC|nr:MULTISPECIES: PH domain-containing protein [Arthrobacter]MBO0896496.1 PH domain-containing protein [Arthrobacter sunyaminii]MBO0908207.1 PH domain-containing protein [Arthrobacter sunyaminii]QWQ37208.1 PH domain-containing protein [Arthrobacter sunyaminii]
MSIRLNLAPGERIIVASRPHARQLAWPVVLAVVVCAAAGFGYGYLDRDALPGQVADWRGYLQPAVVVIAAVLLARFCVPPVLRWAFSRYIVTNQRLIHRQGVLRRRERELSLASVFQLEAWQTVPDRMQRSGTLVVDVGYGQTVHYEHVPEVHKFKAIVLAAIGQLPMTAMFDGVDIDGDGEYDYEGRGDE